MRRWFPILHTRASCRRRDGRVIGVASLVANSGGASRPGEISAVAFMRSVAF
jgi:hypothetical protein